MFWWAPQLNNGIPNKGLPLIYYLIPKGRQINRIEKQNFHKILLFHIAVTTKYPVNSFHLLFNALLAQSDRDSI